MSDLVRWAWEYGLDDAYAKGYGMREHGPDGVDCTDAYADGYEAGAAAAFGLVAWAEAIRARPERTEPCEWCGKPTAAWRAMCDACEWGTERQSEEREGK